MIARVSTAHGEPGRIGGPDFLAFLQRAAPAVQKQPGFKGLYVLADRATGEGLAITLWETERQAEAMGENPNLVRLRDEAAREAGAAAGMPPGRNYEVIFQA